VDGVHPVRALPDRDCRVAPLVGQWRLDAGLRRVRMCCPAAGRHGSVRSGNPWSNQRIRWRAWSWM